MNPRRRFLGIRDAAEYTGLSKTNLLGQIHAGRLKGYRVGRRIVIDARDLDDFVMAESA